MVVRVSSQISSTSWFISSRVKASSAPKGSSISSTEGLNDRAAHDRGALLHAARQFARIASAEAVEADAVRAVRRSRRGRALVPLISKGKLDVGVEVAPGQQVGVLEHHADLGVRPVDRLAVEQDLAAGQLVQPRHRPQQRRLAAARRADDRDDLAVAARRASSDRSPAGRPIECCRPWWRPSPSASAGLKQRQTSSLTIQRPRPQPSRRAPLPVASADIQSVTNLLFLSSEHPALQNPFDRNPPEFWRLSALESRVSFLHSDEVGDGHAADGVRRGRKAVRSPSEML